MDDTPKMETEHGRVLHGGSMVDVALENGDRLAFFAHDLWRVGQVGSHDAAHSKGTAFVMLRGDFSVYYLAAGFRQEEMHELLAYSYIALRYYRRKEQTEDWEAAKRVVERQGPRQGSQGPGH